MSAWRQGGSLAEPEVVVDDTDIDSSETEHDRGRRWWGLVVAIVILVLLIFCCVTATEVWRSGGRQQAQFVARNVECLKCHTELIPDFSKTVVHNPFALEECTTCHTPHGKQVAVSITTSPSRLLERTRTMLQWLPMRWWLTLVSGESETIETDPGGTTGAGTANVKGAESLLIAPMEELCWTCHGSMGAKLSDPFQHQPFQAGRCVNCHSPHASDYRGLLAQAPDQLCFTCHPIGRELSRAQAHVPVEEGNCIDCHDPHASQHRGVLVAAQRELCFRCHPSVAAKDGMAVQHEPFLNDNCTGCHEPHGSDYLPLLIADEPALCYECHPGVANEFAQPSAHPVELEMDCSSCHDPHAAQYRGLVNAQNNRFCNQCHETVNTTFVDSNHSGQLCIRCHTPHGSNHRPMLVDRNPDLCLQCHPRRDYGGPTKQVYSNKHPVDPKHYDVNNDSPLTCTSSCHNPHGTDKNHMLRYFASPYDGGCLMCHAVTNGARVGIDY